VPLRSTNAKKAPKDPASGTSRLTTN
jgi:hypothetical protein